MGKKLLIAAFMWGIGAGVSATWADALAEPCPIEWRGVPVGEAVRELAKRLGTPYILDPSVNDEMMARTVRLSAAHLNGGQAFRWTVRLAGMEAAFVEGTVMIAVPERLPRTWRQAGTSVGQTGGTATAQGDQNSDARRAALSRKAAVAWVDAPLSRVARDVSERFGMDVVFHPRILEEQPLVRLEGEQVDMAAVKAALDQQLAVSSRYDDGVLWVEPRDLAASRPATEPSGPGEESGLAEHGPTSVLSRPIDIRVESSQADEIAEALMRATGIRCQIEVSPGGRVGPLSGKGTLAEVLEAGRLVAGWDWKITPGEGARGPILLIQVGDSGRSVP